MLEHAIHINKVAWRAQSLVLKDAPPAWMLGKCETRIQRQWTQDDAKALSANQDMNPSKAARTWELKARKTVMIFPAVCDTRSNKSFSWTFNRQEVLVVNETLVLIRWHKNIKIEEGNQRQRQLKWWTLNKAGAVQMIRLCVWSLPLNLEP